jgi:hypothetical protein
MQDRRGRIHVVTIRQARPYGPPEVFDSLGRHLGPLGRRGEGPGETTVPYWIDAGYDDTIRVFEAGRVVVFDADLRHVRTYAETTCSGMRHVAAAGRLLSRSATEVRASGQRADFVHRRSADGTAWSIVPEVVPVAAYGPNRVLRSAYDKRSGTFWIAQFATHNGQGYDLWQMDSSLKPSAVLRRRPPWWHSAPVYDERRLIPSSRVIDVRDLGGGLVAVLIAQPRSDWRSVEVDEVRVTGWWNMYDSIVEVQDWRRRVIVSTARMTGYPQRILSDTRVATYAEEDGIPFLDVWKVPLRP